MNNSDSDDIEEYPGRFEKIFLKTFTTGDVELAKKCLENGSVRQLKRFVRRYVRHDKTKQLLPEKGNKDILWLTLIKYYTHSDIYPNKKQLIYPDEHFVEIIAHGIINKKYEDLYKLLHYFDNNRPDLQRQLKAYTINAIYIQPNYEIILKELKDIIVIDYNDINEVVYIIYAGIETCSIPIINIFFKTIKETDSMYENCLHQAILFCLKRNANLEIMMLLCTKSTCPKKRITPLSATYRLEICSFVLKYGNMPLIDWFIDTYGFYYNILVMGDIISIDFDEVSIRNHLSNIDYLLNKKHMTVTITIFDNIIKQKCASLSLAEQWKYLILQKYLQHIPAHITMGIQNHYVPEKYFILYINDIKINNSILENFYCVLNNNNSDMNCLVFNRTDYISSKQVTGMISKSKPKPPGKDDDSDDDDDDDDSDDASSSDTYGSYSNDNDEEKSDNDEYKIIGPRYKYEYRKLYNDNFVIQGKIYIKVYTEWYEAIKDTLLDFLPSDLQRAIMD
jgi:hypothetical protein